MPFKRFLALGDSYTIGVGVPPKRRWPNQMVEYMRSEGLDLHESLIIAQNGWTTKDLISALSNWPTPEPFDLVSILIGVNNQYQGLPLDEYRSDFIFLLKLAIRLSGKDPNRVIVLSIPDWGMTPFAEGKDQNKIRQEIDMFNEVNQKAALSAGSHYIDLTSISRTLGSDPFMLAEDGLHPSGQMYAEWVKLISPASRRILQRCIP